MLFYQNQRAQNDSNGNPLRLFVVFNLRPSRSYAPWVAVYEDGYRGKPKEVEGYPEIPPVQITNKEYREQVKAAKAQGIYYAA